MVAVISKTNSLGGMLHLLCKLGRLAQAFVEEVEHTVAVSIDVCKVAADKLYVTGLRIEPGTDKFNENGLLVDRKLHVIDLNDKFGLGVRDLEVREDVGHVVELRLQVHVKGVCSCVEGRGGLEIRNGGEQI
jgi:hypothetical protein